MLEIEVACPPCPVATTLMLLNNKWKVLIISSLVAGEKRFTELCQAIDGVSPKVITTNLRDMEEYGLINRTIYPEIPPRVIYSLTPLGESLKPIIDAMAKWGKHYQKNLNY